MMGEARRRKAGKTTTGGIDNVFVDDERVQAIFATAGEPITVALVGGGLILPTIASLSKTEFMKPRHRILRLAFNVWDRIRTGEINGVCGLCNTPGPVEMFSCFAVVERARGDPRKKPAVVTPVCHRCDNVSPEETQRRVMALFPIAGTLPGGST